MKKQLFLTALTLAGASLAFAQTPPRLGPLVATDTTLAAGSEWYIDGVTYVEPGVTLTIEPGVTIYANDDPGANATALIVTSGATINAVGTPDAPIVFTSILEMETPLDHNDVGLWGGVILLGEARINADSGDLDNPEGLPNVLTNLIEGLDPIGRHGLTVEAETAYLTYGGSNDTDSSGMLSYVSIRHTGDSITGDEGDEIQGLTLGGVGSGTMIENLEVFGSDDDGIEIFGGTVNLRNIVLAYATDDTLDLDQGYRGMGQNIVILQSNFTDIFANAKDADKGGEWDGADSPETNYPRSHGVFSNITFVAEDAGVGTAVNLKAGAVYQVWNSVYLDYATWLDLRNTASNNIVQDAVSSGATDFVGNIFESASATFADIITDNFDGVDAVGIFSDAAKKNLITADAGIMVTRDPDGNNIEKVTLYGPAEDSPVLDSANVVALPDNGFFKPVSYVGAFDGQSNWAAWTFAARNGYISIPGWTQSETYGSIYTMTGNLAPGQWVYSGTLQKWILIAADDENGSWIYIVK